MPAPSSARWTPPSSPSPPRPTPRSPARCSKPASMCLVEKPIAHDLAAADRLVAAAERHGRILQVGHLERFNPAVLELERRATLPLFFEIHRLNVFSPRSLDVDVVLDLMIHDVDIVLCPGPRRARGNPRRGHPDSFPQSGYRQRAPAVPQRLHRQPDRQPHLHRARPQAAPVPAPPIPLARLRPPGPGRFLVGADRQIGFEQAPVSQAPSRSSSSSTPFWFLRRNPQFPEMLRPPPRV